MYFIRTRIFIKNIFELDIETKEKIKTLWPTSFFSASVQATSTFIINENNRY